MSVIEVAVDHSPDAGRLRVQVVDSPVGHASADAGFDLGALLAERERLERALLLSGISARRIPADEEKLVQDVGGTLFLAVLGAGEVASRYRAAVAVADERDESLRIVLRINSPALAALPWEAMYDTEAGGYVCRQHQLVRHVPVAAAVAPLPVTAPLRILGVVSSPRDLPPIAAGKERQQLARALAGPVRNGLIELAWAPSATWADLQDRLLAGPWHVIHYIGHGDFDAATDEGRVALVTEEGSADLVEASRLADLLRQARPMPRLVVLNSCQGAAASTSDLFAGTASALVRNRVTAVAAMQYAVSDAAAVAFARGFYSALAHGREVDDAVNSGRAAIIGSGSRTLEWLTPVLYLRGGDARLFDLAPPAARPAPADAAAAKPEPGRAAGLARKLADYAGAVNEVVFHPDGTLLATSGDDKTVRLWDAGTGNVVSVLTGHMGRVSPLAFSPGGDLLASASSETGSLRGFQPVDTSVRTWDPHTGAPLQVLRGHAYGVTALAFSPDGGLLASASLDQTVNVWDGSSEPRHTLTSGPGIARALLNNPFWSVAFSPDGTLIAAGSSDKAVRLWDAATGEPRSSLAGLTGAVRSVAFSPDGAWLAADDGQVTCLWEVAGEPGWRRHEFAGSGLSFSPDSTLIATRRDGAAELMNIRMGLLEGLFAGRPGRVQWTEFSSDGRLVVTGSSDHTARVWAVDSGECVKVLNHPSPVMMAVFSPAGSRLATVDSDKTARLWAL